MSNIETDKDIEDTNMTGEHPFDTKDLHKGSVIDVATLERAYSVERGTDNFRFACLKARDYIDHRFRERGIIVVIVIGEDHLRILTDEEASVNREKRIKQSFRHAKRALIQMGAVDRAQLSPKRLGEHDREFEVLGRAVSAAARERRIAVPPPTERKTPLPPGAPKKNDGGK